MRPFLLAVKMAGVGALNILLGLNTAAFTSALQKSQYQMQAFTKKAANGAYHVTAEVENLTKKFQHLKNIISSPHGFFAGFLSTSELVKIADDYGQYASRLKQATESAEEFREVQQRLFDMSNRVYKSYADANELFIRISSALKQLGYDAQETVDLVSTVEFGLTVDSADTQRTQSVIKAISDSILAGKMGMQQFNTVVAASPSLFQALADSIAGGSQQALRKMVSEGKVTANELMRVSASMEELGRRADEMPATVADAFVRGHNKLAKFVGELNESHEMTQVLVKAIDAIANNLDIIAAGLGAAIGTRFVMSLGKGVVALDILQKRSIAAAQSLVDEQQATLKANREKIRYAINSVRAAVSADEQKAATEKLTAALRVRNIEQKNLVEAQANLVKTSNLASRALNFVGGPLGALSLAVSAGAMAWTYFSRETEGAKKSTLDITKPIEDLRKEFELLGQSQRAVVIADLEKQLLEQKEPVEEALRKVKNVFLNIVGDGTWQWQFREISKAFSEEAGILLNDASLTAAELDERILAMVESFKGKISSYSGTVLVPDENIDRLLNNKGFIELIGALVNLQKEANETKNKILDLQETAAKPTKATVEVELLGMEKWEEYLRNLENARNIVGMNTRQLAEFKAEQQGANEVQKLTAGIIAEQEQSFKDLQEAIRKKDHEQEEAALKNLEYLVREQVAVEVLAGKTNDLMSAVAEFARNGTIAGLAEGATATLEEVIGEMEQRVGTALERVYGQTGRIKTNTKPDESRVGRPTRSARSGGGSRTLSELAQLNKSLELQVAMLGMTELEQQRYRISLMTGSDAAKAHAIALTEKIAAHKEEIETMKAQRNLMAELSAFRDQEMLPILTMGMGNFAREQLQKEFDLRSEYANKRKDLDEAQQIESTRISQEAYERRLEDLRVAEEEKLKIIRETALLMTEAQADWALGAKAALEQYAEDAAKVYDSMGNAVSNAFKGMEDALVSFVMTGKADFKSLANSIISDMMRIAIQQSIMGPLANMFSGMFGGGASSASWGPALAPVPGFDGGGYTGHGGKYELAGIVHKGEYVFSKEATNRIGVDRLERLHRGYASGGYVGSLTTPAMDKSGVKVEIHNHAGVQVDAKTEQGPTGEELIRVILTRVENKLAGDMAGRQGAVYKATQSAFGLSPVGV